MLELLIPTSVAECPALGEPPLLVLVPLPDAARGERRVLLRKALRRVLAASLGLASAEVSWRETPSGPRWTGAGYIGISLSYGDGWGLIGLRRDGPIGVDLAAHQGLEWWASVVDLYLDPSVAAALHAAGEAGASAAADAWAEREARCKRLGLGLSEWSPERARRESVGLLLPALAPADHALAVVC